MKNEGPDAAERQILNEQQNSFFWVRSLSRLLGTYEDHRDKYPNLDSFFMEIVQFFNTYAASIDRK